jgi:hypothetical protein
VRQPRRPDLVRRPEQDERLPANQARGQEVARAVDAARLVDRLAAAKQPRLVRRQVRGRAVEARPHDARALLVEDRLDALQAAPERRQGGALALGQQIGLGAHVGERVPLDGPPREDGPDRERERHADRRDEPDGREQARSQRVEPPHAPTAL